MFLTYIAYIYTGAFKRVFICGPKHVYTTVQKALLKCFIKTRQTYNCQLCNTGLIMITVHSVDGN